MLDRSVLEKSLLEDTSSMFREVKKIPSDTPPTRSYIRLEAGDV